jgi:hypothetical protein
MQDYSALDDAICRFLEANDGHPTNNSALCEIAGKYAPSNVAWRLVDRRMQAMKKSGRIAFVGRGRNNPSGRSHGWIVRQPGFTND